MAEKSLSVLAEVVRGRLVESRHRGFVVIANAQGEVRWATGPLEDDPVSYMRSAAKPVQALPLVESGAADRFDLTPAHLALACASHNGEPHHTRLAQEMLDRGGLRIEQLLCGAHLPYHLPTQEAMLREGRPATNLHSNCSGKHAGMLLTCLHNGWPTEDYTEPDHPLQQAILKAVAECGSLDPAGIPTGVDGCSVVCFGLTTRQMATVFARFADPSYWSGQGRPERSAAVQRLTSAMWSFPFNVGGTGRGDTGLMESAPGGRVFSKVGAEAVWCMGFPEHGLGLAMKIEDGASRAEPVVLAAVLRQTGLLSEEEIRRFEQRLVQPLLNVRGRVVGQYRAVIEMRAEE